MENIKNDIKLARRGVLFLAIGEIVNLISVVGLLSNLKSLQVSIFLIYGLLVQVPAYILLFLGCHFLKKFHANFSYGGVISIATIVLAILSVLFPVITADGWATTLGILLDAFVGIFHIMIAYYCIRGIRDCYFAVKNDKMTGYCNASFGIFMGLIILVFVLEIALTISAVQNNETALLTLVIMTIVFSALAFIYLIVFYFKSRAEIGKRYFELHKDEEEAA